MNVMLKLTALFLLEHVRNVLWLINSRKYSLNTSNKKLWLDQPALWLESQRASWESRICLVICRHFSSVTCGHFVKPPKDVPLQVGQTSTFARARGVFYHRLRTFLDIGHLAFLLEHQKLKWVEFGANCRRRIITCHIVKSPSVANLEDRARGEVGGVEGSTGRSSSVQPSSRLRRGSRLFGTELNSTLDPCSITLSEGRVIWRGT